MRAFGKTTCASCACSAFLARFEGTADEAALAACARNRDKLLRLAGERVWGELRRLLTARGALPAIELMEQAGVWRALFPVAANTPLLRALLAVHPDAPALTRLAALLRGPHEDDERVRPRATVLTVADRTLKLATAERETLLRLVAGDLPAPARDGAAFRRTIHGERDPDRARSLQALAHAERQASPSDFQRLLAEIGDWSPPPLPISGADLQARGIKPGPALGALKRAVEQAWVESDFRMDRTQCLATLDARARFRPAA